MVGAEHKSAYSIRAVARVCAILDLVQRRPHGFSILDVGGAAGLPKSSAFRYLSTLEAHGYVVRDPRGNYRIGPDFPSAESLRPELLLERARPHLEVLRDLYRETINLVVLDGNRVIHLEVLESPRSLRLAARKGDREHLHCTAGGKAIAAVLPEDRLVAILEAEGMPAHTPRTITKVDEFLEEVELTRRRGYAIDDGEHEPGGRCVAVAVPGSTLPAAVSLSAPEAHLDPGALGSVALSLTEVAKHLSADQEAPTP
jgi:IclR family transcriptional regulator, acetate operon repressor